MSKGFFLVDGGLLRATFGEGHFSGFPPGGGASKVGVTRWRTGGLGTEDGVARTRGAEAESPGPDWRTGRGGQRGGASARSPEAGVLRGPRARGTAPASLCRRPPRPCLQPSCRESRSLLSGRLRPDVRGASSPAARPAGRSGPAPFLPRARLGPGVLTPSPLSPSCTFRLSDARSYPDDLPIPTWPWARSVTSCLPPASGRPA